MWGWKMAVEPLRLALGMVFVRWFQFFFGTSWQLKNILALPIFFLTFLMSPFMMFLYKIAHMHIDIDSALSEFFLSEEYPLKSPGLEYSPKAKLSRSAIDGWLIVHLETARRSEGLLRFCSRRERAILRIHYLARIVQQPEIISNRHRSPKIRRPSAREMADLIGMSVSSYRRSLARARRKVRRALIAVPE